MKRFYFIAIAIVCVSFFSSAAAQTYHSHPLVNKGFRMAVGGGYALRLGKVEKTSDPELNRINNKLLHGFSIDADAQYFFKEKWGLGLNANYCSSNTSGNGVTLPGQSQTVNYKETQHFIYIGPSFVSRSEWDKFILLSNVGIGPLFFNTDMNINSVRVIGDKTTIGFNAGIAGEYKMNNKTGIGLKLSYVIGYIDAINIQGQSIQSEKTISVSNLMLTAFLSFRTW